MEPVLSSALAPFILFAATMSATPGPNNAMLAASAANFGFRRTLPHLAGVAAGFALMLLLVALGAGQVLRSVPGLQPLLRWVGAFYLLYLAVQIARTDPAPPEGSRQARPLTLLQAAAFQWVNPKAWIISIGAVTTYTTAEAGVLQQALVLAIVFFVVTWPSAGLWAGLGAGAGRLLQTRARMRAFNWLMAALLILSLVPALTE